MAELWKGLVSQEGTYEDLGLAVDQRNLDLAPENELAEHLQSLYEFCLATRQTSPWHSLDEDDWRKCEFMGRNNGIIARTAKNLPIGLVHWQAFDPSAFKAEVERAYTEQVSWSKCDPQGPG